MGRTLANPETLEGRLYLPTGQVQTIAVVPSREDIDFMGMALHEAEAARLEGNPAIGAVLVTQFGGKTISVSAHSTEITTGNLDAHAEHNAYHKLREKTDGAIGLDLSTVAAYVTSEPCDGCTHRFVQGHLGRLTFGSTYAEGAELGYFRSRSNSLDTKLKDSGRTILVVGGFMREEALALLERSRKVH